MPPSTRNKSQTTPKSATIVQNRKARHDYHILERFEAGIALTGTEVKSCRQHNVSLADAYARVLGRELYLIGAHIAPYEQGNRNNHPPRRDRKLLMHRREIQRLSQQIEAKGLTLIPLRVYFKNSRVKVELGLCKGKQTHDKRQDMKKKMHDLEARRAMESRR